MRSNPCAVIFENDTYHGPGSGFVFFGCDGDAFLRIAVAEFCIERVAGVAEQIEKDLVDLMLNRPHRWQIICQPKVNLDGVFFQHGTD